MSSTVSAPATAPKRTREEFTGRWAFILAAIGSAVGLGNIWRFPYVAYENGGGAFVIPYLIALLTAGIPLLFFDYAIGHRFRGSAPLAFRRLSRWTETVGWWQVLICVVIGIYYAAIIGWAIMYTWFSVDQRWGDDPETFLMGDYLQVADDPSPSFDFVSGVFWPMLAVWVITLLIMGFGVRRGVALASMVGIPLLVVMFPASVHLALTEPTRWDDTLVPRTLLQLVFVAATTAVYVGRRRRRARQRQVPGGPELSGAGPARAAGS